MAEIIQAYLIHARLQKDHWMFDRETAELIKATLMLHTIKADLDRLDLVLELQRHLVRQITRLERRVKRVKRVAKNMRVILANGHQPRNISNKLKLRIKACAAVISELQHKMFIWRCYGDGIAFAYQSKYTLKHLYYDQNYSVKQTAGSLSGKTGFRLEWKFVKLGIKMGVPVVLSDITNVIRTGDVCALGGADPLPVEVKSGKSRNERTDRQIANLKELTNFFRNDGAANFRGVPNVVRQELRFKEVNHLSAINGCIADSKDIGIASVEPEPGLRYFAIRDYSEALFNQHVDGHLSKHTVAISLTPEESWLPAEPFTLSLDPANLIEFIQGKVVMLVLIDAFVIKNMFRDLGIHSIMLMDNRFSIQVCKNPANLIEGAFRLSDLVFARIATEFQSLKWFVKEHASVLDWKDVDPITLEEAQNLPGFGWTPPPDWSTAKDFYDR